jgi:hypothetical protein
MPSAACIVSPITTISLPAPSVTACSVQGQPRTREPLVPTQLMQTGRRGARKLSLVLEVAPYGAGTSRTGALQQVMRM